MAGTFFGIGVAQSGLSAQKRALDILGYNIAHANDPTYKRQKIVMVEGQVLATAQESSAVGCTAVASGVGSGDVERVRNALIENRLRQVTTSSAQWDYMQNTLSQLETMIAEPSDTGMQSDIDAFWNSWQTVANNPESTSIRSALLEDTTSLCQRIQYTYGQMADMRNDLDLACVDAVDQINLIASEIGSLNNEIGALSSGQVPVNDLLNRRDALVQELASYVDIQQFGEGKDSFIISVGGSVLVQGTKVNAIKAAPGVDGEHHVQWADNSAPVDISGGELRAIVDLRDTVLPDYMSQLDDMATSLVANVNTMHHTGLTLENPQAAGGDFFRAGTTAANISLDASIVGHPELIAASSSIATQAGHGNGEVATAIANLKTTVPSGDTLNKMYADFIGGIGSTSAAAQTKAEANSLSVEQFTTQQQAVSGVSLDEELTNMIKFQQAYNASSRVLTAMNDMLEVLMQTGT